MTFIEILTGVYIFKNLPPGGGIKNSCLGKKNKKKKGKKKEISRKREKRKEKRKKEGKMFK